MIKEQERGWHMRWFNRGLFAESLTEHGQIEGFHSFLVFLHSFKATFLV